MACGCKSRKGKRIEYGLRIHPSNSKCKNYAPVDIGLGICKLGHGTPVIRGGKCSVTTLYCEKCPDYSGPIRGIGDIVHKLIQVATFGRKKPCKTCLERRARWNKGFKKWQ